MTDRELLEAAAKVADSELLELAAQAAGLVVGSWIAWGGAWVYHRDALPDDNGEFPIFQWHPLADDGDALRLAVTLGIDLSLWINTGSVTAKTHIGAGRGIPLHGDYQRPKNDHTEPYGSDPYAATRRAIVRAAAAIWEAQ